MFEYNSDWEKASVRSLTNSQSSMLNEEGGIKRGY